VGIVAGILIIGVIILIAFGREYVRKRAVQARAERERNRDGQHEV
jgi:hypothetical protein